MNMTAPLDPETVRDVVEAQFPHLAGAIVTHLGEGCDSTAFEVNGTWVFRFPKRPDVEVQLLTEMRVLPVLAERAAVPLPAYCFHGRPSPEFPRHFGGYSKRVARRDRTSVRSVPPCEAWQSSPPSHQRAGPEFKVIARELRRAFVNVTT